MNVLIIYASKYGCTADCAAYLKDKLSGNVKLADINKTMIQLDEYDSVIIGASVYMGKISKTLRKFCTDNKGALLNKKAGLFLCCAQSEQADSFLSGNFPSELIKNAAATGNFGSEARLEKMGFLDKTIIKAVSKGDFSNFKILYENIDKFAKDFNK